MESRVPQADQCLLKFVQFEAGEIRSWQSWCYGAYPVRGELQLYYAAQRHRELSRPALTASTDYMSAALDHACRCDIIPLSPLPANPLVIKQFPAVHLSMVVREVLDNGLRLITETMPHVRSVTIGVWLTRGSRHESDDRSGIAHFVEHMLFKGTDTRTAEDIAQSIDSIGGQLDAFTAKEYASYYIKVLDEHLPLAVDLLADIVLRPAFAADEIEREKKVILEEIKMVEDTPDDLVHELFTQHFWEGHPLGRPILGSKETVEALTPGRAARVLSRAPTSGRTSSSRPPATSSTRRSAS